MRLALIGDRVVDNEKELYTAYIRRLEIELERAHSRISWLEENYTPKPEGERLRGRSDDGEMHPLRPSGMSFAEARRRVQEFESKRLAEEKSEPEVKSRNPNEGRAV